MKTSIFLLFAMATMSLQAQEILVNSFQEKPFYEFSDSEKKKDGNGVTCALVNVYFSEKGASFEGSYVVGSSPVGRSYQVYLAGGASKIMIKHNDYIPTPIVFSDFGIKKLESNKAYDLILIADKSKDAYNKNVAQEDFTDKANSGDAEAQYKLGKSFYLGLNDNQDYEKAITLFKKSTEQGNINASYNLGLCYLNGQGTEPNFEMAEKYLKNAAEKGHAMAQFKYANYLMTKGNDNGSFGAGYTKNINEAIKWYESAASQNIIMAKNNVAVIYLCYDPTNSQMGTSDVQKIGFPEFYEKGMKYLNECEEQGICEAYLNLGNVYLDGIAVQKDAKKAFEYYQKAIENGYYAGYNNIARCYFLGSGVKQDYKKAFKNFKLAAQKGFAAGYYGVALCYEQGKGTWKNMKQAAEYYQKAADQDLAVAETQLGALYLNGTGVNKDQKKAFELFSKAAQNGDPNGYANMGTMYHSGQYVDKDIKKAIEYYNKAADMGNIGGLLNLAILYQTGNGVPIDGNKAISYYERACKLDRTGAAYYNLGTLYYSGCGSVGKNYQMAYEMFEKSAKENYAPALYNIGVMYLNGQYVNKNENIGISYIERAAKQSYQPAVEVMDRVYKTRLENTTNALNGINGSSNRSNSSSTTKQGENLGKALKSLFGK